MTKQKSHSQVMIIIIIIIILTTTKNFGSGRKETSRKCNKTLKDFYGTRSNDKNVTNENKNPIENLFDHLNKIVAVT